MLRQYVRLPPYGIENISKFRRYLQREINVSFKYGQANCTTEELITDNETEYKKYLQITLAKSKN